MGCGAISANYFKNAKNLPILEMAACADLDPERARERAAEFEVPTVGRSRTCSPTRRSTSSST